MAAEAELAEERIKEAAPLVVVRLGELEDDGNMRLDVHRLKYSSGRRRRGRCIAIDGGLRRGVPEDAALESMSKRGLSVMSSMARGKKESRTARWHGGEEAAMERGEGSTRAS